MWLASRHEIGRAKLRVSFGAAVSMEAIGDCDPRSSTHNGQGCGRAVEADAVGQARLEIWDPQARGEMAPRPAVASLVAAPQNLARLPPSVPSTIYPGTAREQKAIARISSEDAHRRCWGVIGKPA
jgi:hypothetical protein